jgi:predicted transcriptional regulator
MELFYKVKLIGYRKEIIKLSNEKTKCLYSIDYYMTAMEITTIQISKSLLEELKSRKMYDKESYEDIIKDLLEDTMELSEETLANIKKSEEDIKEGRFKTLSEVEARLKK